MIRRRLGVFAGAITLALAVGACGSGEGLGLVSETASAELTPRVTEIRGLAAGGHPEFAAAKLLELEALVEQLRERGDLSDEGAAAVLAAAFEVEEQLLLITTTTTATTVPPTTAPPDEDEDEGRGNGNGNGRDRGDDD